MADGTLSAGAFDSSTGRRYSSCNGQGERSPGGQGRRGGGLAGGCVECSTRSGAVGGTGRRRTLFRTPLPEALIVSQGAVLTEPPRRGAELDVSIAPARVQRAAADDGLALPAPTLPACTLPTSPLPSACRDARCFAAQPESSLQPISAYMPHVVSVHAAPPHAAPGCAAPGTSPCAWGGAEASWVIWATARSRCAIWAIWVIWAISAAISAAETARGTAAVLGGAPPPWAWERPPCGAERVGAGASVSVSGASEATRRTWLGLGSRPRPRSGFGFGFGLEEALGLEARHVCGEEEAQRGALLLLCGRGEARGRCGGEGAEGRLEPSHAGARCAEQPQQHRVHLSGWERV